MGGVGAVSVGLQAWLAASLPTVRHLGPGGGLELPGNPGMFPSKGPEFLVMTAVVPCVFQALTRFLRQPRLQGQLPFPCQIFLL